MMQHRPDKRAQHEFDTKSYNIDQASSQGWHFGIGDNFLLSDVQQRNTLIMPTSNQLNFRQFGGQTSEVPSSVCRQEHGSVASSVLPPKMGEYLVPETQQDQACPSYSYLEPNSRDSTLAQGRPQLMYPELHGVPHYETTSPYMVPEEPVYVNAKQYHAILRRRQLRAKAEVKNKLRTVRKPYLHESRHLHALRRARGCGGRFVNTKKPETSTRNATDEERNGIGDSPALKKLCSESDSGFSSAVPSGKAETSTSVNDFKKFSLEGSNCAEFFQWRSYCS